MKTQSKTLFTNLGQGEFGRSDEQIEGKNMSHVLNEIFDEKKEKNENVNGDKTTIKPRKAKSNNNPSLSQVFPYTKEAETSEVSGLKESVKKQVSQVEVDRQKLENMVSNSNRLLIGASAVFPVDFFPDTINVEATRVNIIRRSLFFSEVHSVDIKDITNVFLSQSLFFASLAIVSKTFVENQFKISRLWKKDAVEVRRIIEGLRMIARADIDMNNYSVEELTRKLKELSSTEIVL
ncbi:MAG: hypothetical protein Q7T50_02290 [Candidatus Magasanikbacteria bacterium]|nr:hypothetical protein [Candidatus Magasanikbacteria bacterium]